MLCLYSLGVLLIYFVCEPTENSKKRKSLSQVQFIIFVSYFGYEYSNISYLFLFSHIRARIKLYDLDMCVMF